MAKTIKPADLGKAINQELMLYHEDIIKRVNLASEETAKELVKRTKKTAPKQSGDFRKAITYVESANTATGNRFFKWGAKAPHHRLTHLLVHGHAKKDGGRVPGDPFLENALDELLPDYEKKVEEAVQNGQ
jgi:hypothetical protein